MLQNSPAFSSFSVNDTAKAKTFYTDILGLAVTEVPEMGLLNLKLGSGNTVMIYPKGSQHQPASFTVLTFPVTDIDAAVDHLADKGVQFERYEGFDQDEKGIARSKSKEDGPSIAWFTDPDGNIMSLVADME